MPTQDGPGGEGRPGWGGQRWASQPGQGKDAARPVRTCVGPRRRPGPGTGQRTEYPSHGPEWVCWGWSAQPASLGQRPRTPPARGVSAAALIKDHACSLPGWRPRSGIRVSAGPAPAAASGGGQSQASPRWWWPPKPVVSLDCRNITITRRLPVCLPVSPCAKAPLGRRTQVMGLGAPQPV